MEEKYLSWFLGPKAENAAFFEELILLIARDYIHWRRNYFPGDKILLSKNKQREFEQEFDKIHQNALEIAAELRRNFPFYSPRYIGHMLSETSIPSMVGYFAGMLYNPNNVTTEAAPVTVDFEIEACNQILHMLGYNPPPSTPDLPIKEKTYKEYEESLKKNFGWAHISPGGTSANLEALWVARNVKYFALSILDVSKSKKLDIQVKKPYGGSVNIRDMSEKDILLIEPGESIKMLKKYITALKNLHNISSKEASESAIKLLKESKYSISNGFGYLFSEYPPVIFVSGTAHYSIKKISDLLGIGSKNVETINITSKFRIDINDLDKKIERKLKDKYIPLAVIANIGTTEEGAIDPLDEVVNLRKKYEKKGISFWIHADAAWGGFIKSIFIQEDKELLDMMLSNISNKIGIKYDKDISNWQKNMLEGINKELSRRFDKIPNHPKKLLQKYDAMLSNLVHANDYNGYMAKLKEFRDNFKAYWPYATLKIGEIYPTLQQQIEMIDEFTKHEIVINYGAYRRTKQIQWSNEEVLNAYLAFKEADSITIDPHKLGYVNYPCGVIAFKNDEVRYFITQEAPYITSVRQDVLMHFPPKHIEYEENEKKYKIFTEAFGPFILDGSRPGAAASSLFLSLKTIPLTKNGYGLIIKSSLLAARELYEWLISWKNIRIENEEINVKYEIFTLTQPDTNVVIFTIKDITLSSISDMNKYTERVYKKFSIETELGERRFSYSQPFFLSKTSFKEPQYPFESLNDFFKKAGFYNNRNKNTIKKEYQKEGITVLRATVMTPYLHPLNKLNIQNLYKEFIEEIEEISEEVLDET